MLFSACSLLETAELVRGDSEESPRLDILAPNLEDLRLTSVDAITSFKDLSGVKNLQILFLNDVTLNAHLSMLFSACPLLRHATLMSIYLGKSLSLDIVAPNLQSLMFVLVGLKYLDEFVISSAPVLEEAMFLYFVDADDHGRSSGDCKFTKILGGMPNIKKLKLFEVTLRSNFNNSEVVGVGPNFWEAQDHLGVSNKLETVKMFNIVGVKAELAFIQFVLGKGKLLKKLMVGFQDNVIDEEPIKSELSKLSMISNQAQIQFM